MRINSGYFFYFIRKEIVIIPADSLCQLPNLGFPPKIRL